MLNLGESVNVSVPSALVCCSIAGQLPPDSAMLHSLSGSATVLISEFDLAQSAHKCIQRGRGLQPIACKKNRGW